MKKLLKITTCALMMGLSCMAYAETDAASSSAVAVIKLDDQGMREDLVFQFMRKYQLLKALERDHVQIVNKLPFTSLYKKLEAEKDKLSQQQFKKVMKQDPTLLLEFIGQFITKAVKIQKEDESPSSKLQSLYEFMRSTTKDYLAIAEKTELFFSGVFDFTTLVSEVLEINIIDTLAHTLNPKQILKEAGMSEQEAKEIMAQVFNNEVEDYKQFVEENKDILEKVAKFADKGFLMETSSSKKCKIVRKKEVCTSGNKSEEITRLSQIIPYIMSLQETQAAQPQLRDL